jgi:hypothetical protein
MFEERIKRKIFLSHNHLLRLFILRVILKNRFIKIQVVKKNLVVDKKKKNERKN